MLHLSLVETKGLFLERKQAAAAFDTRMSWLLSDYTKTVRPAFQVESMQLHLAAESFKHTSEKQKAIHIFKSRIRFRARLVI